MAAAGLGVVAVVCLHVLSPPGGVGALAHALLLRLPAQPPEATPAVTRDRGLKRSRWGGA